jgi:hypothetical protein
MEDEVMHTKDKLSAELHKAGLPDMAIKAAGGYYHDYLSPLETPCLQLEKDLRAVGTPEAETVRQRHLNGEFDASREESDAWAASPDGQAAFAQLVGGRK